MFPRWPETRPGRKFPLSLPLPLIMSDKSKKLRSIFFLYCFLLAYILAALVWWFIALDRQNKQMAQYEIQQLNQTDNSYQASADKIKSVHKRKTAQDAGEGVIVLNLMVRGAVIV